MKETKRDVSHTVLTEINSSQQTTWSVLAEGGGVEGRGWYATQTSSGDDAVDMINNRRKYLVAE